MSTPPAPVDALIGRSRDLDEIDRRFRDGARVVSLLGPGGIGKTSIAASYAAIHEREYAGHGNGGVPWCDLTGAASSPVVARTIAAAVGCRLDVARDEATVFAAIGRTLARGRRALVVLDNCEQVTEAVASALRAWLGTAPRARFLVTSRTTIGIAEEHQWVIGGLDVPPLGAPSTQLAASDAVALFARRAARVRPGLVLADADLEAVADIVRRLDGWPLAIELAAARVKTSSIAELRDQLARPLDVLERTRDHGKHRSIREVVLASTRLLDADVRAALAATSVFRGGFTREAAAIVLGGSHALASLDALVDASLVRVEIASEHGDARYDVFEPIREVARELAAPEVDAARDRHARFYAALVHQLEPAVLIGERAALARLDRELDNVLAAHAASTAIDPRRALAIALAIDPVLERRGAYRLREQLAADVIAVAPELAGAQLAYGRACRALGDLENARVALTRALELAQAADDRAVGVAARLHLGELVEVAGSTDAARAEYTRALTDASGLPPGADAVRLRATIQEHLGHSWRRERALDAAESPLATAYALYRRLGDRAGLASASYELAVIALFRAEHAVARAWFDESLGYARELASRPLEAAARSGRGVLVQELGELDAAIADHAAAVQTFRDLGNRHREASASYYLASAYAERGELATADALIAGAVELAETVGATRYVALLHGLAGACHALRGRPRVADQSFELADTAARACHSERSLVAAIAIHRLQLAGDADALDRARSHAHAHDTDDTRLALRLLANRASARATPRALAITSDGATVRVPGVEEPIDLSRRVPPRRVLLALARQRLDAPGEPLGLDDLVEAGWPGEQIQHDAAVNRVHVALTTLRNAGLREVLLTSERGYLLDPAVPLEWAPDAVR